jgi:dihydroneopterin aldolase
MRDTIVLEGLRVECIVGDLPHERTFPQELFLDMALTCDLAPAGASDLLSDTVNYVAVIDAVRQTLIEAKCQMIERAAQLAVEATFAVDSRVLAVEVTVRKPHALPGVVAGVRIYRERAN